ncbi:hypothetical protein ACWOMK_28000 [Bacillus thuringiensis]
MKITGINSLVYQEKLKREQWGYRNLVGSNELTFHCKINCFIVEIQI